MGWKDEIRNGPIQTLAAIVALIASLVSAGVYFATRSDDSDQGDSLPTPPRFMEDESLPKLPKPPFIEGESPPKFPEPPFVEGELPSLPLSGDNS